MAAERNNVAKDRGADALLARQVVHICQPQHCGTGGMRALYDKLKVYPTSTNGDEILIRSHIAYWSGNGPAERVTIKASRGNSYRVNGDVIVRITDHYDHREGVRGWR